MFSFLIRAEQSLRWDISQDLGGCLGSRVAEKFKLGSRKWRKRRGSFERTVLRWLIEIKSCRLDFVLRFKFIYEGVIIAGSFW